MNYEVVYQGFIHRVKFKHQRLKSARTGMISNKGGCTIAYIKFNNTGTPFDFNDSEKQPWIISAVAECSMKDCYVKSLGRLISFGRLKKDILTGTIDPYILEDSDEIKGD